MIKNMPSSPFFSCSTVIVSPWVVYIEQLMIAQSSYSEVPALLVAFAPQYRKEHFHLHGRNIENWQSFKSIFLDQHYEVNKLAIKVLKGALLGFVNGILLRNYVLRGPKKFELDRIYVFSKSHPMLTPIKGYTAFGAFLGATWWMIKDQICLPHGQDTLARYILAHALMGGVLFGTIVHPANILYGCVAGAVAGGFLDNLRRQNLPRNFELHMKSANEDLRRKLKREDEEYELSLRHVLVTGHNLYPI